MIDELPVKHPVDNILQPLVNPVLALLQQDCKTN